MKQKALLKLIPLLLLVIIGAVLTSSCARKTADQTQKIKDITARQAFELIQENKDNPDFIIVDVRTSEEFNEGHIENALNIDFYSDSFKADIGKLDRDKKYLIYCRSGGRSKSALAIMVELDFKEVSNLSKGIIGWNKAEGPTVK